MSLPMGVAASAAVTVLTTATKLEASLKSPSTTLVYNNGAVTVYVGGSDVTSSTGVPVAAGTSLAFDGSGLYGIAASSCECRVLEGK